MLTNSDFRELLKLFEKHEIRYLVVWGKIGGKIGAAPIVFGMVIVSRRARRDPL
jgi:hypothetical protein